MRLILGSQSPRRKEILSYFSLPFEQITPSYDEDLILFEGNPMVYATILSEGKSESFAGKGHVRQEAFSADKRFGYFVATK